MGKKFKITIRTIFLLMLVISLTPATTILAYCWEEPGTTKEVGRTFEPYHSCAKWAVSQEWAYGPEGGKYGNMIKGNYKIPSTTCDKWVSGYNIQYETTPGKTVCSSGSGRDRDDDYDYSPGPPTPPSPPSQPTQTCATNVNYCTNSSERCTYHNIDCPPPASCDNNLSLCSAAKPYQTPATASNFSGWPTWSTGDMIKEGTDNKKLIGGDETDPLFDAGEKSGLLVNITNVPQSAHMNASGDKFIPGFNVRNGNDIYEFPPTGNFKWNKYTQQNNKVTAFIMKVDNPSILPSDPKTIFGWANSQFVSKKDIVNSTDTLSGFEIKEPGNYLIGVRLNSGSNNGYDFKAVKINFTEKQSGFGWLPIQNNLTQQVGDKMLVNNWSRANHNLNLKKNNSLKVPSAFNFSNNTTAIGSAESGGIVVYDKDMRAIGLPSLPADAKVNGILEYKDGYLIGMTTNGIATGVVYVDVKSKVIKQINVGTNKVNAIYREGEQLYIATNTGLVSGTLSENTFTETSRVMNANLFSNGSTEISSIQILLDNIILTSKTGASGASEVVMVSKM